MIDILVPYNRQIWLSTPSHKNQWLVYVFLLPLLLLTFCLFEVAAVLLSTRVLQKATVFVLFVCLFVLFNYYFLFLFFAF